MKTHSKISKIAILPLYQSILKMLFTRSFTANIIMLRIITYLDNDESWITACNCGSGATGGGTDCCGGGDTCWCGSPAAALFAADVLEALCNPWLDNKDKVISDTYLQFPTLLTNAACSGDASNRWRQSISLSIFYHGYVPVSFMKFLTAVLRNLFGTRWSGETPVSPHDGQIWSSVDNKEFLIPGKVIIIGYNGLVIQ